MQFIDVHFSVQCQGKVEMELELLTAEEAERKPAGVAHEEPEALAAPKWVPLILIRLTRDRAVSFTGKLDYRCR